MKTALHRALDQYGGSDFARGEFGALLLEHARRGDAKPAWMWEVGAWPQLDAAPERATREARGAFARSATASASRVVDANA